MRRFILIFAALFIATTISHGAFAKYPTATTATTATTAPTATTATTATTVTVTGALIKMDSVSYDFGRVNRKGNALIHTFVATNVGTSPLVITEGSTTCSCIKVKHPKRPIAPQQSAPIEVKYELERKDVGPFHKVIKIFSNSVDGGCQVLTIHGIATE